MDHHNRALPALLIHAIAGPVLGRIEKAELALPVAKHVRLQVGEVADLADREELLHRLRRGRRGGRAAAHRLSAFSSRSIRSLIACRAGMFWNSTLATSRAMVSSTPWRSPSPTPVRV